MPRPIETHERRTYERANRPLRRSSDRAFGLVLTAAFAILGALPLVGGQPGRPWAFAVSAAFLTAALLAPRVLAPVHAVWRGLGEVLRRYVQPVVQTVVLAAIYFGVVTPIGVIGRAFGKDPLRLAREPSAGTYWIPREPPGPAPDSLARQF